MTILQAVCILNAVHLVADILRVPILWPVYKSFHCHFDFEGESGLQVAGSGDKVDEFPQ